MEKWSIFNLGFCPKKNCYPVCFFINIFIRDCLLIFFIEKIAFQTKKRDFLKRNEKSKFFKGVCLSFLKKISILILCGFWAKLTRKYWFVYNLYRKEFFLDKHLQIFFLLVYFVQKTHRKKIFILHTNHGLTRLKNFHIFIFFIN